MLNSYLRPISLYAELLVETLPDRKGTNQEIKQWSWVKFELGSSVGHKSNTDAYLVYFGHS